MCIMNDIMIIILSFKNPLSESFFFFPFVKIKTVYFATCSIGMTDNWWKHTKLPQIILISIQNKNVLTPHAYNKNIFIMILFTQI